MLYYTRCSNVVRHGWFEGVVARKLPGPSYCSPRRYVVIECRVCQAKYVTNTLYCTECGTYLLGKDKLGTDPIEKAYINWLGKAHGAQAAEMLDLPGTGPLSVRLIIRRKARQRELQVSLVKPVRLGRSYPAQNIFPEVDLTDDLALECGVSREHVRILARGRNIIVEDLGSTNGTLLNGKRLDPYIPEKLAHGDQLQLGKLLIEVRLR